MLSGILNTFGFGNEDLTKDMDELQKEMYQSEQLRKAPVTTPSLVAEDSGPGLMDRLSTSRIQTWNPQTMKIEEQEVPTWWRAGKGLAAGLSAYGRNLLISGGDEGKAWAGGIDAAFGSLDSEVAAQKKSQEHQARVAELVKDGKYTPESISVYARSGDPSYLVPEKMVMSQKEAFEAGEKVYQRGVQDCQYGLDVRKQQETERSNRIDEAVSQMNAESTRLNARYNMQTYEKDGKKYVQQYDVQTKSLVGEPMLFDSKDAQKALEKQKEELKNQDAFLATADTSLSELDHYLSNPNKVYQATQGHGPFDVLGDVTKISQTDANIDRGNINKYVIGDALESLAAFKGATTDFEYLKAEAKNVNMNSAADVERFLKKVRMETVKAKADANGYSFGADTKRKPPQGFKSGQMFTKGDKNYVVVGDTVYELNKQVK